MNSALNFSPNLYSLLSSTGLYYRQLFVDKGLLMSEDSPKPLRTVRSKKERMAFMDKEILDVEGAALILGVSSTTIYTLARKGEIPATRVGREWRFARSNLIQWVVNGSQAAQIAAALHRKRGKR